jgi:cytochrome oxidase assembly protein ShyY1
LNEKEEQCGIMVNKGWVPKDLVDANLHGSAQEVARVTGVLYRGDNKTKYSRNNAPMMGHSISVVPEECAILAGMPNKEEASQFMLLEIEQDENNRAILPNKPTVKDLTSFKISPERHLAYSAFWNYMVMAGVVSNTFMWLYF